MSIHTYQARIWTQTTLVIVDRTKSGIPFLNYCHLQRIRVSEQQRDDPMFPGGLKRHSSGVGYRMDQAPCAGKSGTNTDFDDIS